MFTGVSDRALYNAGRQTLVDEGRQGKSGYRYAYTIDAHTWNLVDADGLWLHVDVSSSNQMVRDSILLENSLPSRADRAPEATEFLKELLVPGSTK